MSADDASPLDAMFEQASRDISELQEDIYALAETATMLPLGQFLAYLDAMQATEGRGIPKDEWAQMEAGFKELRSLAEPLYEAAKVYTRLEAEHLARAEKKRPS